MIEHLAGFGVLGFLGLARLLAFGLERLILRGLRPPWRACRTGL